MINLSEIKIGGKFYHNGHLYIRSAKQCIYNDPGLIIVVFNLITYDIEYLVRDLKVVPAFVKV